MMRRFEEQVKRGIALLDKKKPGWRNKVNINELQMHDCSACILGQVFGNYGLGLKYLCGGWTFDVIKYSNGFSSTPFTGNKVQRKNDWDELRDEWILQLSADSPLVVEMF